MRSSTPIHDTDGRTYIAAIPYRSRCPGAESMKWIAIHAHRLGWRDLKLDSLPRHSTKSVSGIGLYGRRQPPARSKQAQHR